MLSKEFLEEYSLFRKYLINPNSKLEFVGKWDKTPINMHCPQCGSNQTFIMTNEFYHEGYQKDNYSASNRVLDLNYICTSCQEFERKFYVYISNDIDYMYKIGQYPEWEIKMDSNLEKVLGNHAKIFRKGLVCESQGYGIGAFAYYRRITENIIDELLNSIYDLIDNENQEVYRVALNKTKETRVTQEKIDLVKDLMPSILKPNGLNPLGVLHSELSAGLHAESDEDCLENANHIKSILIFLINQIIQSKESAKNFSSSMKSLLDKKSKQ
ncbi:hypothetical protein LZ575_01105 [Antarcticibacterium sp. 1MA-6-2]|uniref:hypothetical protein n=1 Tax=Antarcticibacterium sp. 1MA-6-2 TaxID=2908210 RepID=UPI001F445C5C|nr:hypothetical protein [Antarcticibacterium sp. 1MA-6-2]UJH91415.1 hypothetical protein LZ575_01105 [Antarcticibacterium sp. 1MA-6-2]